MSEQQKPAIDSLMDEVGEYLWSKTKTDWILSMSHIVTEPVCISVYLSQETGGTREPIHGWGDTLDEAIHHALKQAKAMFDKPQPQSHSSEDK